MCISQTNEHFLFNIFLGESLFSNFALSDIRGRSVVSWAQSLLSKNCSDWILREKFGIGFLHSLLYSPSLTSWRRRPYWRLQPGQCWQVTFEDHWAAWLVWLLQMIIAWCCISSAVWARELTVNWLTDRLTRVSDDTQWALFTFSTWTVGATQLLLTCGPQQMSPGVRDVQADTPRHLRGPTWRRKGSKR